MPGDGARRLGAVKPPLPVPDNNAGSSSTALAGFAGSASSSTAHSPLFRRCVLSHCLLSMLDDGVSSSIRCIACGIATPPSGMQMTGGRLIVLDLLPRRLVHSALGHGVRAAG